MNEKRTGEELLFHHWDALFSKTDQISYQRISLAARSMSKLEPSPR